MRSRSLKTFWHQNQGTPSQHRLLLDSHESLFPVPMKVLCGLNPLLCATMTPQKIAADIQLIRSYGVSPDFHWNQTSPAAGLPPTLPPSVAIQIFRIACRLLFFPPTSLRPRAIFLVAVPKTALTSLIFATVR